MDLRKPTACATRRLVRSAGRSKRRGLAPLELVLSLPIMLFVMALIVDFGNMAPWKVRTAAVAREAVYREQWPHNGGNNPLPAGWPPPNAQAPTAQMPFRNASLGRGAAQPNLLSADPFAEHTVVRGPSALPNSPLSVDTSKVDFPEGLFQGTSHIQIRLPLLPGLPNVVYDLRHPLLDNKFQYSVMGYPSNEFRRIFLLYSYSMPADQLRALQAYALAVLRVYAIWVRQSPTEFSPGSPGVLTLDRDDEFIKYLKPPPQFHPEIRASHRSEPPCETDREQVRITHVLPKVIEIQGRKGGGLGGVPEDMATRFINLYEEQIRILEAQQPPPQALIDALKQKVDQLKQFRNSLF